MNGWCPHGASKLLLVVQFCGSVLREIGEKTIVQEGGKLPLLPWSVCNPLEDLHIAVIGHHVALGSDATEIDFSGPWQNPRLVSLLAKA